MLSTSGQDNGGVFPQEERTIGDFIDKRCTFILWHLGVGVTTVETCRSAQLRVYPPEGLLADWERRLQGRGGVWGGVHSAH